MAALRGCGRPLVQLGESAGPIFLYRCPRCGALWEETLREAHVVTPATARAAFPGVRLEPDPA